MGSRRTGLAFRVASRNAPRDAILKAISEESTGCSLPSVIAALPGVEGASVAAWLNGLGVTSFVLAYRHGGEGYRHPVPMLAAQRARARGGCRLSGCYGIAELQQAGAFRVYEDPADMLHHIDEIASRD